MPRFHLFVFLNQYIVFFNQYTQWKSLKQSDYNRQAPTQLFVKTRPHWSTADKPCVCSPSHPCLLLMCVFNLPRVKVHWLQGLRWFWEDGKMQWLDKFGQGVWCAWESSRDFSKILGLLAGRRFLRGPIILPWVEFKCRDQSSSFVWQGADTSATWRWSWWGDR